MHAERDRAGRAEAVIGVIDDLQIGMRDVETGQRGYLLTGEDAYLAPYTAALGRVSALVAQLREMTADNPVQQERLRTLAPLVQQKLAELARTVDLRRNGGLEAAIGIVRGGSGRDFMERIKATLALMADDERAQRAERMASAEGRSTLVRWLVGGGALLAVVCLLAAARLLTGAWTRASDLEAAQRTLALRLRTSFDSISQGLAVFDADRLLTHRNTCFQVLLDLPEDLTQPGIPYASIAAHTVAAGLPTLENEDQVRHGPGDAVVTYERFGTNGHLMEFRRTQMPDGGFVVTVSDMTNRAKSERILREAQKMQAIGQLTGGIAHDFNNLLLVVIGNLDLARSKIEPGSPLGARLDRAIRAAERGAALTSQLLAFARKQPLAPAAIDLAAAMPDLVPLLRRTLGERIDVRYVETAGLWPAMADPAQLESAVLNLALNARDAMPDGGRLTIELSNRVLDEAYARAHDEVAAGDFAMVAVSDTGHGMAPDVVARAFEPFFTTKKDGKGTGLGLAMVFGFVKQSGGHVKVYSEPGEGTTVRLYLPRAVGAPIPLRQRMTEPVDLPRGSATILVVEDEPGVREIAVTILRELGYRVLEASDGDEGLRVFCAEPGGVDLLLTDVVLPGALRGRELSERITALRPEVKVLFMSGYTENSIVHSGRLDDGVQLLGKPFKREQLARKVADVLAQPGKADGQGGGLRSTPD